MRELDQRLLDALDGVSYMTDVDGTILAVGRDGWDRALARAGSAIAPAPESVIGRSLFDFVRGEKVRETYRRHMALVAQPGRRPRVFEYRCDTPGAARVLRMAISALRRDDGGLAGYLFQSVELNSVERVPIALFSFETMPDDDQGLPYLGMCSYCQRVRFPAGSPEFEGEWIEATEYYRRGGDHGVVISHGVCPDCFEGVVQENIRAALADRTGSAESA